MYKLMRKFTKRELYLISTALGSQRDATVNHLKLAEKRGQIPLFTPKYIEDEHNALIELIITNTKKK